MITLYHCVAARSFRPLWALEELGLPYQLNMLAFPPRVVDKGYLEINPLGTVPLLCDGATRMTESSAICHYLAAKYGPSPLIVNPDEADFGPYLNFLHFGEATLTFPQTIILRYEHFESPERRLPQAASDYRRWFLGRLKTLAPLLSHETGICAGRFTMADISVGYALLLAEYLGLASDFPTPVGDYWRRLNGREAYIRAREVETAAAAAQGLSTVPSPLLRPETN